MDKQATQKRQGDQLIAGSAITQFKPVHGMSTTEHGGRSPTYTAWRSMRHRCNNPHHKSYDRYGGRDISVCPEWNDFTVFLRDMGEKPAGVTLGRINNDGNYEPGNCRWETHRQQANNRVSNRVVSFGGVTRTLTEWARVIGIAADTLAHRLNKGWPVDAAMTTPVKSRGG